MNRTTLPWCVLAPTSRASQARRQFDNWEFFFVPSPSALTTEFVSVVLYWWYYPEISNHLRLPLLQPRRRRQTSEMAGNLHPATTPYHGVGRGLLEAVFAESKRFFDLPMEDKMALLRGANHRGYTPPYAEKLDASSQFVGPISLPAPAAPLHWSPMECLVQLFFFLLL